MPDQARLAPSAPPPVEMPDPQLLVETLADFARTPTGQYEIVDVLYDLAGQVTDVLGITGADVALIQ